MLQVLRLISFFVFFFSMAETVKPIKKVLSIVKDIRETLNRLAPIIENGYNCNCCNSEAEPEPEPSDSCDQGIS